MLVTTLPALILGGAPGPDPEETYALGAGDEGAERARARGRPGAALPADGDVGAIARPPASSALSRGTGAAVPDLHRPSGSLADGADPLRLSPEEAGWTTAGCGWSACGRGATADRNRPDEAVILPLSTTGLTVEAAGER